MQFLAMNKKFFISLFLACLIAFFIFMVKNRNSSSELSELNNETPVKKNDTSVSIFTNEEVEAEKQHKH